MDAAGVAALRASAMRDGVPIIEDRPFAALVDALLERIKVAAGQDGPPRAVINVGGALIGLGSCRESYELPPGVIPKAVSCTGGTPGLATRLSASGLHLLHVINIRRLAVEWGLPIDPVPLPTPGDNKAVYGSRQRGTN
jgi:poly-gamma-glutamate system protein